MDKLFKNILPFTIIPIFVFIFAYSVSENDNSIEITVRTPEIENRNVILKLIKEINDINDVIHVETSIQTNTFMIVYNDNYNFSQRVIEDIFSKWGCDDIEITYALVN